jgi:hypothetical protein
MTGKDVLNFNTRMMILVIIKSGFQALLGHQALPKI